MVYLRKKTTLLVILLIGLIPLNGQAAPVSIENLRMWRAPDHTRLVFDLSGPVEHRLFTLSQPHRAVLDINNVRLKNKLPKLDLGGPMLSGIRTGKQGAENLRVVLDLKVATSPRTYLLKPYDQYGYRLVVDLQHAVSTTSAVPKEKVPKEKTPVVRVAPKQKTGPIVIAIDAGHGGEDPGAIGRRYRTREKDVVLAISREVHRLIKRDPGMRSVLTRSGDYFVPLGKRRQLAQRMNADVFISIHADSLLRSKARGSSVYALSQKGATSAQARLLSDRENASDLIGGVDLAQTDDVLAKVLVDMSQTATISSSIQLGQHLLKSMKRAGPIHIPTVGQAGFAVLKSPAMPSVLIETTFISHPGEERKLRSRSYQRKMAASIYKGLRSYVRSAKLRPRTPGRTVAVNKKKNGRVVHVVRRGDTLSEIAQIYRVNLATLKLANNIRDNKLFVGEKLVIPN